MCDCPLEKINGNVPAPKFLEKIPNFGKCWGLPVQREDYADEKPEGTRHQQQAVTKNLVHPEASAPGALNNETYIPSRESSLGEYSGDSSEACAMGCEDEECVCSDKSFEEESDIEQTLAIIKPEAIVDRNAIEKCIFEEGFEVLQSKYLKLTSEQVSEFYGDGFGTVDFVHFLAYMSSGPIVAEILARKDGLTKWRTLMGPAKVTDARLYFPDSLRARYGRKGANYRNSFHGSATREQAEREIHFFFPQFVIEPLPNIEKGQNYLKDSINSVLAKGLEQCCKVKPAEPVLWLGNWLLSNNPNMPKFSLNNDNEYS